MAQNYACTHNDWKALKKQHGIPDKVCPFSLGDKLGAYSKAVAGLKDGKAADYELENRITLDILLTLRTYATALAKVKPEKFKGKNAGEQTKSFNAAKEAVSAMVKRLENHMTELKVFVQPFSQLLEKFPEVEQKYNSIGEDDKKKLVTLYGKELRNDLGLPISQALKLKIGDKVKAALQEYEELMDRVTAVQNHHEELPPNTTMARFMHQLIGEALAAIKPYIK